MKICIYSFVSGLLTAYFVHKMAHCPHMRELMCRSRRCGKVVEDAVLDSLHKLREEGICKNGTCCQVKAEDMPPQA